MYGNERVRDLASGRDRKNCSARALLTGRRKTHKWRSDRPLERLATLLAARGVEPDLNPGRLAPSTIYDLEYRVLVVAMAFQVHAADR